MRVFRRLAPYLLLLALPLWLAAVAGAMAQPAPERAISPNELLDRWELSANDIERELDEVQGTRDEYARLRSELEEQASRIPALLEQAEAAAQPLREQMEALGPPPEDGASEAESVAAERERIQQELSEAEALITRLNQAKARSETLIAHLIDRRRALFTDRLMTRGPSPVEPSTLINGFRGLERTLAKIANETSYRINQHDFTAADVAVYLLGAAGLVALLLLLHAIRRFAVKRLEGLIGPDATQARRVTVGVLLTLARLVAPIAAIFAFLIAARVSAFIGPEGFRLLLFLGTAAVIFVAAWALSLAFFAPGQPALRLSTLDDASAARAHWWIIALAGLVAIDQALVESGRDLGLAVESMTVLNSIILVLGGIALWQVIHEIAPRRPESTVESVAAEGEEEPAEETQTDTGLISALNALARLLGRISAILAPGLALLGYFAASRYAFYPLVISGAVICFCLLLYQVVQALVERVAGTMTESAAGEAAKGRLRLIPVLLAFVLTCAALPVLALIWGATVSDLGLAWRRAIEGVQVGEVRISPSGVFTFLVIFSIGFLLTRLIQSILSRSVLPLTRLDTGGRDAIRAGVGYLGVTLAAFVAISSAGIDLSNLAIALGALSVGIGFGLQNVVNNFVSGIILLIERPIKTGDWVELGSGMGYVKQINVRSTEIETFDRSSLIVPNSELISSPVINWTHANNNGRIIVPVGVAYGTDPRKVEKILLEIAKGHPMLLRRPAPYVLFNNFGPDALLFEIRGVLRDVNWVLNTASDLRYEIVARFAAEGIQIPYAQRDLHLKNVDELGRAIGSHLAGKGEEREEPSEPDGQPAVEDAEDDDADDGVELLRMADPQARRLVPGPAPRTEDPEPPWETLAAAEEHIDSEGPEDSEDDERQRPPALRRAAGNTDSDGAGGDGR